MATPNIHFVTNPKFTDKDALVIFAHGFTGDIVKTWDGFEELLKKDDELGSHDFCFWGYPSKLKLRYAITKYFWENDPDIDTIGRGLRTLLNNIADDYKKIILVGHSMGGLVIQAFILEEVVRKESKYLSRLTEVILYATPSAGLEKARWGSSLKNQVADMKDHGPFVQKLRTGWTQLIDDNRSDQNRIAQFRLTLVAGMSDNFVPPESSLNPFPFDEKEFAPGNHTEMVKPSEVGVLPYLILKKRLLRPSLTAAERKLIYGESDDAIRRMKRVQAAAELNDVDNLTGLAHELSNNPSRVPPVEKALGLALLDNEQYPLAVDLLTKYVEFQMPDSGARPFATDAQAIQQLAIALSGTGDITGAVTRLKQLAPEVQKVPETLGILAGRFKRQWLKNPDVDSHGWESHNLYKAAYESAKEGKYPNQAFYNGINTAYMSFALEGDDYTTVASEVLQVCESLKKPDYWSEATRAEALLLLGSYSEAHEAYKRSKRYKPGARHWSSTGQQALDIINRQGNPPEAKVIVDMFQNIKRDYGL